MFGGLRQGSLLYVLDKNSTGATMRVAEVESVSNPQPRYGMQIGQFGNPNDMVVDVRIKDAGQSVELKQLATNQGIANSGSMVVSDSKEAMSAEVEALMRTSRQIVESVPYHEKMLTDCEAILRDLNPQFAKEKEREEKIEALEGKMDSIEGALDKIQSMLANLTSK
jgi:ribosome-associated translation inhibitor RaiA